MTADLSLVMNILVLLCSTTDLSKFPATPIVVQTPKCPLSWLTMSMRVSKQLHSQLTLFGLILDVVSSQTFI